MRVERWDPEPAPATRAREVRAAGADLSVRAAVAEIVADVRARGDDAVIELTQLHDTGGRQPWPIHVDPVELSGALDQLDPVVRDALELAAANVRSVALAGLGGDADVELAQGQRVRLREVPVRRAAIYVPGGRAPYPSTVVMGVVTAQVAGVEEIAVCAPPGEDGNAHPVILAACALLGVEEAFRMGGAQAVAALALGTESVPAVDVVVGPGNAYVQEAKRQLSDTIGIEGFAGPSELLAIWDGTGAPEPLAWDLLAQAEHGPDSVVVAVAPARQPLDALAAAIDAQERGGEGAAGGSTGRCLLVEAADLDAALEFAEALAPEHLQLMGPAAEALAPRVRRAGCLFVGTSSGTAFGDYVAGSNHVLPTGGAARFASALSPRHFRRRMSEVTIAAAAPALAPAGAAIARAEGFEAHARSMEARIGDNDAS